MTTLLFSHPACEDHIPNLGHPESPVRLKAIREALAAEEFAPLLRREAPRAEESQIARVHPGGFVRDLLDHVPSAGEYGIVCNEFCGPGHHLMVGKLYVVE